MRDSRLESSFRHMQRSLKRRFRTFANNISTQRYLVIIACFLSFVVVLNWNSPPSYVETCADDCQCDVADTLQTLNATDVDYAVKIVRKVRSQESEISGLKERISVLQGQLDRQQEEIEVLRNHDVIEPNWVKDAGDLPQAPCLTTPPWLIVLSSHVSLARSALVIIVFHEDHSDWVVGSWRERMELKDPEEDLDLYCMFQDGSSVPVIHSNLQFYTERARYFECILPEHTRQLYKDQGYLHSLLYDKRSDISLVQLKSIPSFPFSSKVKHNLVLITPPLVRVNPYHFAEWVEYNRVIGVDHLAVYICNTKTEFTTYALIQHYLRVGFVTLVNWCPKDINDTERSMQNTAYVDALYRFMDSTRWMMIVDPDEFMLPVIEDSLTPILHHYGKRNIGALKVQSFTFGPCNVPEDVPSRNQSVISRFRYRKEDPEPPTYRTKVIYQPRYAFMPTVHFMKEGTNEISLDPLTELHLNHYQCAGYFRQIEGITTKDSDIYSRYYNFLQDKLRSLSETLE